MSLLGSLLFFDLNVEYSWLSGLFCYFFPSSFFKKNFSCRTTLASTYCSFQPWTVPCHSASVVVCLDLLLEMVITFSEHKYWLPYCTLPHKGTGKSRAPTTPFHDPPRWQTLNYPAWVTFVSPKCPVLLIFKGVTHICVPQLRAPALYFQWKHSLTSNPSYFLILLHVPFLQSTMCFTFRSALS